MGLDMYLYARKFIWTTFPGQERSKDDDLADAIKAISPTGGLDLAPKYVIFEAMYWRKANAIHKWFVDNVQEGNDDCGYYYVDPEKLRLLQALCVKVLEDRTLAHELLPPQEGFFFGGTEIDEWYERDLVYTRDAIAKLLAEPALQHFDLQYHSSW